MKIIYVNQCFFTYFLIIFHATKASTHWIVTEDGKIHTQDDSIFQMRRPYDLMSLLQQEKRAKVFAKIKAQLMAQKEEIESENFDNQEDVEQMVYLTSPDCLKAKKPLVQFDLYVGTMVFSYPRNDRRSLPTQFPIKMFHNQQDRISSPMQQNYLYFDPINKNCNTFTSSNTSSKIGLNNNENDDELISFDIENESQPNRFKNAPNCSEYPLNDFSMTSFEHLPSVRSRKNLKMDAESEILRYIGKWKSYQTFGKDISDGLKQNSSSWILYTLASFYWRGMGQAEQAIECIRRALHSSPNEYRSIPLLSLATILHRSRSYDDAVIVLHGIIDMAPEIPHSHYILANIYTVMTDYNKSVICLDNVLKLCPNFLEAKLRKHAVLCHIGIENALKTQHENLQKTLDELKDYQRQQELWINYHQKLRSEQAPPNVQLEQRLHYREFKIRQKLEDENFFKQDDNQQQQHTNHDDHPLTMAALNHIQMKLESGKKLFDLHFEIPEQIDETEQLDKMKSKENDEERSNRIKKLLASTATNGNSIELDIDQQENDGENDHDEEINTSKECSTSSSTTDSRPILLPVTFVLPPSD
ncbi:LOW QUALITY PROTEIN: tetratricopeptide repeat protein 17 [Dermatophagoides farinae]|uniref:Tetratricopeptide repeat protein 17 n=1 Tax=Dermatophagoides farinae TaxID=6954 RepID=A0A922LDN9_DERFA|nr:tetratricopeptide repeat protein 17-like [Dermatophagoides farinae]KAH7642607.1 tetratricopeptide repeat protein 17-like protein [Dermatophagoides farinae]KAH9529930.1 Tetratricopeptide repeat protein 17 [Dermatophagoides farinae]